MADKKVEFMPKDSPGDWEKGRLESPVETRTNLGGDYHVADVRDSSGKVHEDVVVVHVVDKK